MDSSLPRFRRDLECRSLETSRGTAFVVKDPRTGSYFRLREVERFVTDQLDGETPLGVVRERVERKFAAGIADDALAGFIRTLDRNGLLEGRPGAASDRRPRRGRFSGNLLHLRFRLIDPDAVLGLLVRPLGWLFSPFFVLLSLALLASAVAVCALHWEDFVRDAAPLYDVSTLPLLAATLFAVLSAHEFAHALTCKRFGGEVLEMGFLLLYFQPALYCDVSDAWLFPKKSRRLWVGFSGPYFELFLWAMAILAWRGADPGTWVHDVSLVVAATSGIKTLFNFNPLIKLDGYYLLSDWLDIPNLRQKSFAYLGEFIRTLGGLRRPLPEAAPRERRIFLAYGLSAWLFSVSLLGYLGLTFGEFLILEGQRLAFVALAALLAVRLRRRLAGLSPGRPKADPEPPRPRRHPPRLVRSRFLWLAAAGALLLLLFHGNMELRVSGPVAVLPQHNADVRAEIDGVVAEIHLEEGQAVRAGDLVARLSGREYRAELQKTEAELQHVRARLDQLVAGPTPGEIEVARSVVGRAQDRLRFARARRERSEALVREQLIPRTDSDVARELETEALNELAEAQSRLDVLLAGTRPEEIRAAVAERARLEAQRDFLRGQLERLDVVSPAAGIVTTPGRQLRALLRQAVSRGGLVAKVHEYGAVTVEALISEKEIADVRVGQEAAVKTRAHPERLFFGRVTEIAPTAQGALGSAAGAEPAPALQGEGGRGEALIRVLTEIDNRHGLLKPGMTGMVKIDCGERRLVDLVLRRLSRTFRVEFWSWW